MVVALITAGGTGTRMSSSIPKQFIKVNNKPIIIHTLEKFEENNNIDMIIIACLESWISSLKKMLKSYNITKVKYIVKNGNTQPESIKNCIKKLETTCKDNDIIVIHVANRPMINNDIIDNSINSCKVNGSGIAAISCPEVVINKYTKEIIDRQSILRIQTPQTFFYKDIYQSCEEAAKLGIVDFSTICDLMIMLKREVSFIEGSHLNIKITYPEDIKLFDSLTKIETKDH